MNYNAYSGDNKKEILTERTNFKKMKVEFDNSRIYSTDDPVIALLVKGDVQMI